MMRIIILLVLALSVILFLTGLLSGLFANKTLEKKTQDDLADLEQKTQEDIKGLEEITREEVQDLKRYISFLEKNLNSMQLEQVFFETLSHEEMCDFSNIAQDGLMDELRYYWSILPFRIEAYERDNPLTQEYLGLKDEYTKLSIRTWVLAKNRQEKCNTTLVQGLYFYSANCTSCTQQGEALDTFSSTLHGQDVEVMVFTVDYDHDDIMVINLKRFYGINATPALLINDVVYQGRYFTSDELLEAVR